MSSVGSRTEFPNIVYSPTPEDDFENQELRPLKSRRPSSYEEMNEADDGYTTEGHLHQYEDPRLLAEQMRRMNSKHPPPCVHEIRPRKKENDLYERCRTDSDGSESSSKSPRCRGAMCFLVSLSLMLALAAAALVVLLVLGQLVPKACENCLKNVHRNEGVPHTGSSSSSSSILRNVKRLEEKIKILEANLTQVHQIIRHRDEVIKKLMETDKSHTEHLNELFHNQLSDILRNSKFNVTAQLKKELRGERGPRGPKGERGPPGSPGKQGSGNISTCVYQVDQAKFSPSASSVHNLFTTQKNGWLIISATCSTEGAAQSNLRRVQGPKGMLSYICQCQGIAVGNRQRTATCFIHYWQCPKI